MMKKIIKRLIIFLMIIVLMIVIVICTCKIYKTLRYKKFNEATLKYQAEMNQIGYCIGSFPANGLLDFGGNISIAQNRELIYNEYSNEYEVDGNKLYIDAMIFPKITGEYDIYIQLINPNNNIIDNDLGGIEFKVDKDMKLLNKGDKYISKEEYEDAYIKYYSEIKWIYNQINRIYNL